MSFKDRFPSPLPVRRDDTLLAVLVDALGDEIADLRADTADVEESLAVETATGQSLDLIGDDFGALGERRGRSDQEFRQVLQSLVQAIDGRGTGRDVRTAVGVGVLTGPGAVRLIEDFSAREYEVVLERAAWAAHTSGTVRELAELADPVAVDRVDPVHNRLRPATPEISTALTETGIETVSAASTPGVGAGETASTTLDSEDTFGVGRFDGEGSFS